MSLGGRLKEERQRLGLSQEALASACETSKRSQINYEKDEQAPGAGYLAAVSAAGVDVVYVLTGARNAALEPQELRLLAAYRAASEEIQRAALSVLGSGLPTSAAPKRKVVIRDNEIGQQINTTGKVKLEDFTVKVGSKRR